MRHIYEQLQDIIFCLYLYNQLSHKSQGTASMV